MTVAHTSREVQAPLLLLPGRRSSIMLQSPQLPTLLAPAQLVCRNLQLLSLPPNPTYILSPTLFTQPAHKPLQHILHHLLTTLHSLPHTPPLASHPAFIALPSHLLSLYPCYEAGQARDFLSLALQLLQCVEESGCWPAGIVKRSHLQSAHGDKLTLLLLYATTHTLHCRLRYLSTTVSVPEVLYAAPASHISAEDAVTATKAELVVVGSHTIRTVAAQAAEVADWQAAAAELYETSKRVNGQLKEAREEEERLLKTVEPSIVSAEGEQQRASLATATTAAYGQLERLVQQTGTRGAALADISNRQWRATVLSGSELQQAAGDGQRLPLKGRQVDVAAVVRRWKEELESVREVVGEAAHRRAGLAANVIEVRMRVSEQHQVSASVQRLQQQVQHALAAQSSTSARTSSAANTVERASWLSLHRPLVRANSSVPASIALPLHKLADLPVVDMDEIVQPSSEQHPSEHEQGADASFTPIKLPQKQLSVRPPPRLSNSPFAYESSAGLLDESIELMDQF